MLRLLLQPPGILYASTGHYLHAWEPVQQATARVPWSRDNFPWEQTVRLRLLPIHTGLCRHRLTLHSNYNYLTTPTHHSSHPVAWVSQSPLISCCFNPALSGQEHMPEGDLHAEVGPNPKLNPWAVGTKKRKGNLSQQPQEQRIKSPHSPWCTLHLWNTWIDNESTQYWGSGLWEQL